MDRERVGGISIMVDYPLLIKESIEPPVPGDFDPDLFDPDETGEDED